MEAPRSRRSPCSPKGPQTYTLLPEVSISANMTHNKKLSPVQVTWILLLATGSTLLCTILLSFKTHLKQSQAESFDVTTTTRVEHLELQDTAPFEVVRDLQSAHNSAIGSREDDTDRSLKDFLADPKEFESGKCASRGRQHLGRSLYIPSDYLIQRLRKYESLHRRCAGFVPTMDLKIQKGSSGECRFIVWIAYSGLGNRLLSLVSAFLYALVTNRVLLVDRSTDMSELFCEPFPGASWLVPPEFPHKWLEGLNESSQQRFGNLLNHSISSPPYSYVHLTHTYNLDDRKFFCDNGQDYLYPIPWLFMRANNYIVPGLYFLSSLRPQLEKLFPEKEAIFHLLGRYLFHPSDAVWSWITRFRNVYLANNGQQVGIQIRTFKDAPQAYFQEQLSRCILYNELLPNITTLEESKRSTGLEGSNNVTSVLVTSLQPEYYERLRDFYMSAPTDDGRLVAVHQPSHEGWQKESFGHDLKAWADIYLLSLSDILITSGWSTFGYSAQALAGLRPWILFRSIDGTVPDPPCIHARSMEPCFHTPPLMDCQNTGVPRDPSTLLPFVQTCEDIAWGIKIIDPVNARR